MRARDRRYVARAHNRRVGLSLLELIVALALTVVVLGAIAMILNTHLRMLDVRRTDVEEAQLARAILQRIAGDLRSAVSYEKPDMAVFEKMLPKEDGGGRQGGTGGGGEAGGTVEGGTESDTGTESSTGTGTTDEESDLSLATTAVVLDQPGLYGTQYELQVDISRVPRPDEYYSLLSPEGFMSLRDIPSDIKTVAYYLQGADVMSGASGGLEQDAGRPGLVRRELDRRVTLFANQNGTAEPLLRRGELMAPEVVAMEFYYFDGLQWLTQWDSQSMGGLPLAVEVVLAIAPSSTEDELLGILPPGTLTAGALPEDVMIFRTVVRIPTARIPETTSTTGAEGMAL